jgi:hypothetical protein
MDFSNQEIKQIKAALMSQKKSKPLQVLLFATLIILIILMFLEILSGENFAFITCLLLFSSVILNGSFHHRNLLSILDNKLKGQSHE